MIFSQEVLPVAVGTDFNWVADYIDGTYISEYDFYSNLHNSFYSIRQKDVYRFGLIGMGYRFFFENFDGSFNINGNRLDIKYRTKHETVNLTDNQKAKDLITYKWASTPYRKKEGEHRSYIDSFNMGYKTKIQTSFGELFFQPVIVIPTGDESMYMEIKMTSENSIEGDLVFMSGNTVIEAFYAPLERNESGQLNWTIKI